MGSGVPKAVLRDVLLLVLLFGYSVVSVPLHELDYPGDQLQIYSYDCLPEVRRQCAPSLPVALAELTPDDTRGETLKNELWFVNGDWSQEPGAVPLIPSKNDQMDWSHIVPGLNVVSFWVMDADSLSRSDNMVGVSGILEIGFARFNLFSDKPSEWSSGFETSSESTKLRITFEGVYVESDENGGERHMCLLGTSSMPDPDNVSMSHVPRDEFSFGQASQIMLLLRYPKTFSLTSRGIYGQLESLATKSDLHHFGKVTISSQLSEQSSTYQFGSAQVLNTYNDSDIWFHGDSRFSHGMLFCFHLKRISFLIELRINLNQKSFVQDGLLGEDFDAENSKFVIRNLICDPGVKTAKVAAEFTVRTGPPWSYLTGTRGMSGKSIFAEGIWNSSEKELRMLGCLVGNNGKDSSICDFQVSLFLPSTFSISMRSTVYGSIRGINSHSESDAMVLFENMVYTPFQFLIWPIFYTEYEYSKLSLASAYKSRHDQSASDLVSILKRTVLEYPSYNPNNHTSLSELAGDLTVRPTALQYSATEFDACNVLSVVLLFGSQHVHLSPPAENKAHSNIRNVALFGFLSITGQCSNKFSLSLSVEAIYDPTVGTMHLIGCKDVRAFPVKNIDTLENGQDCLIEIEVEYPPKNIRWLLNQKLKISVSSQREKQDSLHFSPIVIWTQPMTYPQQMSEEQFTKRHEIYIRFILLLVALFCVTYQLRYMTTSQGEASSGYISLVMLCIQLSSYCLFFNAIWSYVTVPSANGSDSEVVPIDITIIQSIFISISSEFITIARKVWTGRATLNSTSEVRVLIITLSVHMVGLSVFISTSKAYHTWKLLKAYWGLVIDFFLLPQIVANSLWQIKCKPIRKIYYIGFSMIRVFPHLYNFRYPWYDSDYEVNLTDRNRLVEICIAMTVILLSFVVYMQQRCSISSQTEATGELERLLEEKDV